MIFRFEQIICYIVLLSFPFPTHCDMAWQRTTASMMSPCIQGIRSLRGCDITPFATSNNALCYHEIQNNLLHRVRKAPLCISPPQIAFLHVSPKFLKSKKDGKKMEVIVDPRDVAGFIDLEEVQESIKKIVEELKQDYVQNFRVGADVKIFDQLKVSIDGDQYQLREVAKITKKSEKAFELDFISFPEALPSAQASIQSSTLNLNPTKKGTKLEVSIPAVTSEHRKTLVKAAKLRMNDAKDQVRKIRNHYEKQLQKVEHLPKDTDKAIRKQIGVYVSAMSFEMEVIFKDKEKSLLL